MHVHISRCGNQRRAGTRKKKEENNEIEKGWQWVSCTMEGQAGIWDSNVASLYNCTGSCSLGHGRAQKSADRIDSFKSSLKIMHTAKKLKFFILFISSFISFVYLFLFNTIYIFSRCFYLSASFSPGIIIIKRYK